VRHPSQVHFRRNACRVILSGRAHRQGLSMSMPVGVNSWRVSSQKHQRRQSQQVLSRPRFCGHTESGDSTFGLSARDLLRPTSRVTHDRPPGLLVLAFHLCFGSYLPMSVCMASCQFTSRRPPLYLLYGLFLEMFRKLVCNTCAPLAAIDCSEPPPVKSQYGSAHFSLTPRYPILSKMILIIMGIIPAPCEIDDRHHHRNHSSGSPPA